MEPSPIYSQLLDLPVMSYLEKGRREGMAWSNFWMIVRSIHSCCLPKVTSIIMSNCFPLAGTHHTVVRTEESKLYWTSYRESVITGLDRTGLDWTTGFTFDPKINHKNPFCLHPMARTKACWLVHSLEKALLAYAQPRWRLVHAYIG